MKKSLKLVIVFVIISVVVAALDHITGIDNALVGIPSWAIITHKVILMASGVLIFNISIKE